MIRLNEDQERILHEAVSTIRKGNEQVYEYEGKAGTGKTFLAKEICKALNLDPERVLPMAYTGAAGSVLRKKGFYNATTLHRGLYHPEEVPNPKYKDSKIDHQFGVPEEPKTIIRFIPKEKLENIDLIVIDEGYMCPMYMRPIIEKFGIPVLVTGDRHQLPPIGDGPAYLWKDNLPSLKQIMRQEETNPIVYIANMILENKPINCGLYGNKVLVIPPDKLTDGMILNSNMVVCGRNVTRDYWNNRVREILNHRTLLPEFGERVICRKNNHLIEKDGIELSNGLIGYCINQPADSFTTKTSFSMDFLPDISFNPFKDLTCDYEYFTASPQVRLKYNNPFSKGERFEFAYCITTHLAQGSETEQGVYIKEYLRSDIQQALDYTAVTRFKKFLIMVVPQRRFY